MTMCLPGYAACTASSFGMTIKPGAQRHRQRQIDGERRDVAERASHGVGAHPPGDVGGALEVAADFLRRRPAVRLRALAAVERCEGEAGHLAVERRNRNG